MDVRQPSEEVTFRQAPNTPQESGEVTPDDSNTFRCNHETCSTLVFDRKSGWK